MTLALFDLDKTLTTKDSFLDFIAYAKGKSSLYLGILVLSPYLFLFMLGKLSSQVMKEKLLAYFFKGMQEDDFKDISQKYSLTMLNKIENEEILARMKLHVGDRHKVVVVTASLENWVSPWCENKRVSCIGSRAEFTEGKVSGKLLGNNCKGQEKVVRIKEIIDLSKYETVYAYGNMPDDAEMLELAHHKIDVKGQKLSTI